MQGPSTEPVACGEWLLKIAGVRLRNLIKPKPPFSPDSCISDVLHNIYLVQKHWGILWDGHWGVARMLKSRQPGLHSKDEWLVYYTTGTLATDIVLF